MNNIFLAGLNAHQLQLLTTHGVPFCDLSIGRENGVLIEPSLINRVLDALECRISGRQASAYEGIERLVLITIPHVTVANSPYRLWADRDRDLSPDIVSLLSETLHRLHRDIYLHCGSTLQVAPTDGKFHVHIWTVSDEERNKVGRPTGSTIWNLPIKSSHRYACKTRLTGTPIVSAANDLVVADLIGTSDLVVYLDLAKGNEWQLNILKEILQRVTALLLPPEEGPARARKIFVEECSRALTLALAHTTLDAAEHKTRARAMSKQLAAEVRLGVESERKMLNRLGMHLESIGNEYDNLLNIPKVKDVRIEGNNIIVMTDVLNCRDDRTGYLHEIGAFQISIPLSGGSSPNWKNLTRRVNGMNEGQHAPHVWKDGQACLGNTADIFPDLIGKGQFAIAAQLAIEFVQSANTADSAGKHVNKWPLAPTQTATVQPAVRQLDDAHRAYKQKYVAACSKREDEQGAAQKKDLVARRALIEQIQEKLILELRAAMLAERKAKDSKACDRSALFDEYDAICALPKVSSVNVENGVIAVATHMLQCASPETGKMHNIGRFLIKIFIDGRADGVRWINLDAARDAGRKGQQAPQILGSGRALFSDMRENFPDLIAQMQFCAVTMLAIDSIEQISNEDPNAEFINKWPVEGQ